MNHPFALDHTPRFTESGLHDKLIQRCPHQLSRLLEGVLHFLRYPGRNPASFFGQESHGLGNRLAVAGLVVREMSGGVVGSKFACLELSVEIQRSGGHLTILVTNCHHPVVC